MKALRIILAVALVALACALVWRGGGAGLVIAFVCVFLAGIWVGLLAVESTVDMIEVTDLERQR